MLRTLAAVGALSALVLVLTLSLSGENNSFAKLVSSDPKPESLINPNTGAPVTLEAVQKDVEWHRETAQKLRQHD